MATRFTPEMIGKVVTVKAYRDDDDVEAETTGVLAVYTYGDGTVAFTFRHGVGEDVIPLDEVRVEIELLA